MKRYHYQPAEEAADIAPISARVWQVTATIEYDNDGFPRIKEQQVVPLTSPWDSLDEFRKPRGPVKWVDYKFSG